MSKTMVSTVVQHQTMCFFFVRPQIRSNLTEFNVMTAPFIETPQTNGTALMKKVSLEDGDTVGVAVQQSDLPMIQFLVNGEPLHELAINRFRGTVYPSIYLAAGEGVNAALVLEENDFRQEAPNVRFGPVIAAVSIV
jgi:hypothetical protein